MRYIFLHIIMTISLTILILLSTISGLMITSAKIEELPKDKGEEYTKFLLGLLEDVLGIDYGSISKFLYLKYLPSDFKLSFNNN